MIKFNKLSLALAATLLAGAAHASGPLYLSQDSGQLKPLVWDTSKGPIPVYTDGGGAFTYDYDGVTPFLTIERANQITAFAFQQWSQVPTSTFKAEIAGTIAQKTGIADITGANATSMYGVENGYGFWVLYDTDGSILQDYFGVHREAVLGIAFPEFSDADGKIIEATAVMNGWAVHDQDTQGNRVAGVFTHEFGHAINLSHSQVNGQLAYQSTLQSPRYPGVKGCPGVTPVYRHDYPASVANRADSRIIETMFPFIDTHSGAGQQQSTVDRPDDIAGISNLYPTADYKATRGSITGTLRTKDGKMEYSGINVIARNMDDPLLDALSDMTGSATQGEIGPDGRYTINNLVPGQRYTLYIDRIATGGYPTTRQLLLSQGEYWNTAEGNDPIKDMACDATPILAEAGVTKKADFTFNGYTKGVQFTPIVSAFMVSLSKNGSKGAGLAGAGTPFTWDRHKGIGLLPPDLRTDTGAMDRNGQQMLVQEDRDGNGVQAPAILTPSGALTKVGDLNGNICGSGAESGYNTAVGRGMDDAGKTVVGLAYVDRNGNGVCGQSSANEIVPFVWTGKGGIRELDTSGLPSTPQFVRANTTSGDGSVIVGTAGFQRGVAWVNEGKMLDLRAVTGTMDINTVNYDGTRVAMDSSSGSRNTGVKLWNAHMGTAPEAFTSIEGLRYCKDVPFRDTFGNDLCVQLGGQFIFDRIGFVPTNVFGSNDSGSVLVGRAGSFRTGIFGAIWIEDLGWMTMTSFLHKQGVVEAQDVQIDNPIALSGAGSEISAGLAGVSMSWLIDVQQAYVCQNGKSVLTGFPAGLRALVKQGALFGRCEFQN